MSSRAPKRLTDDPTTSSGLRVALRGSNDELPNPEELRRLRAALSDQVGALVRDVEAASDQDARSLSKRDVTPLDPKPGRKRRGLLTLALICVSVAATVAVYLLAR